MDRIEKLRERIDGILIDIPDAIERRCGYVHLYGVAQACVLIAKKRNLDQELAAMIGMLHDVYAYKHGRCDDHAPKGSVLAREILRELGIATPKELETICTAIHNHSDKDIVGNCYDELLKDADVLQHCTYNPTFPIKEHEKERYSSLLKEFGIDPS